MSILILPIIDSFSLKSYCRVEDEKSPDWHTKVGSTRNWNIHIRKPIKYLMWGKNYTKHWNKYKINNSTCPFRCLSHIKVQTFSPLYLRLIYLLFWFLSSFDMMYSSVTIQLAAWFGSNFDFLVSIHQIKKSRNLERNQSIWCFMEVVQDFVQT